MDRDSRDQKVLRDIANFGYHVIHVLGEDNESPFSYSIGFYKTYQIPEVIIIGLSKEIAHWTLYEYIRLAKKGRKFHEDVVYKDFFKNVDVIFKKMKKRYYKEFLGWGLWFYGGTNFEVLQLIYPDKNGHRPWEEFSSDEFRSLLPCLF